VVSGPREYDEWQLIVVTFNSDCTYEAPYCMSGGLLRAGKARGSPKCTVNCVVWLVD